MGTTTATTTTTSTTSSPPSAVQEAKRTFGQSLSGVFDPDSITVFGVSRDQPRLLPQFEVPDVSNMRRLPEPRVVAISEVRDIPEFSNVRNLPEPRIVQQKVPKQQKLEVKQEPRLTVSAQPVREVPVATLQQSSGPAQPLRFTFFQAKPEGGNSAVSPASPQTFNPPPTSFQAVPAVRQEPSTPERRPPPPPIPTFQAQPAIRPEPMAPETRRPPPPPTTTFQAQPAIRPEPRAPETRRPPPPPTTTFQAQPRVPEIRRPEPIPFQARPVSPSSQRQTQPVSAGEENFFRGGQPLFSQPIEIPAEANGGASFSYEAIVG